MHRLCFFFLAISVSLSLSAQYSLKAQKRVLPKEITKAKLFFGMSQEAFLLRFPLAALDENEARSNPFRKVYLVEGFSKSISKMVVYLNNEPPFPLYDFILIMDSQESAKELGEKTFGKPKAANNEWRIAPGKHGNFLIAAWVYQKKLVLAAALPGSEWETEL